MKWLPLVALMTLSPAASAFEFGTPARVRPYRSPQNFALEIRVSPYSPQVDEEANLNGSPFANSFGTNPRVYLGVEFDWQTVRIPFVGTLGPGLSLGRVSLSRNATTITGRASGDQFSLTMYPFTLDAVLRLDALWRGLGVPFVPYAKAGLGVALWRATNSGGTSQDANGISGKGTTWGTHYALGVAFALDAFDRGAAHTMDVAAGINGTYLFLEGYNLALDGINQHNVLHVGTSSWAAGLSFEF